MMQTPSKSRKAVFAACVLLVATTFTAPSYALFAGTANIATERTQLASWAAQYLQMIKQYQQMLEEYRSLNGIRGMADLVNNPALRQYLPADYKQILDAGYGDWQTIRDLNKITDMSNSGLSQGSDVVTLFNKVAKQTAVNEAMYEAAYKRASQRFDDIQVLLDKVNDAPDAKDMADLQGRIQSEQVMMANEQSKLAMLTSLSQAQKDLRNQQSLEINLKASKHGLPAGW
jgi:type IV secretion system protein VirB5